MLKGQEIRINELMTYQSDLINFVLDPNSTRGVFLRAPVGMGKTETLSVLASRIVSEKPTARVLILCPASLQQMWVAKCSRKQRSVSVINRYKYREMLDDSAHNDIWVAGMVYIMSIDFAKKLDISKSISNVTWDLIIEDEFSPNVGARAKLIQKLNSMAKRFVTSIPPWVEILEADLNHEITVIEWDQNNALPPVSVHLAKFILNTPERFLEHAVHEICQELVPINSPQGLSDQAILDRLRSSPVALESTLYHFQSMFKQSAPNFKTQEKNAKPGSSTETVATANSDNGRIDENFVAKALGLIEDLQVDTKLQAVVALLDSLVEKEDQKKHIVVICAYSNTLHYLAADFDGKNWDSLIIHGGQEFQECNETINNFATNGGLLIASSIVLQGLEIGNATDIIFYDFSFDEQELHIILSCFNSIKRKAAMNFHVLIRSGDEDCQGVKVLRRYASGKPLV